MEATSRRATVPAGNGARQAGQGEKVKKMTKSFASLGNGKTLKFFRPAPMEGTSMPAAVLAGWRASAAGKDDRSIGSSGQVSPSEGWRGNGGGGLSWHQASAPVAGLPCPVRGRHRRPPRCPLHRSRSKKFQSFSVSLGMKRLCRFYDFRPMAEARHHPPPPPSLCHPADETSGPEVPIDRTQWLVDVYASTA